VAHSGSNRLHHRARAYWLIASPDEDLRELQTITATVHAGRWTSSPAAGWPHGGFPSIAS